jgi:hypothetical protein
VIKHFNFPHSPIGGNSMDWQVGDIAVVKAEYDRSANECLFYLTAISDNTAIGYLTTGGYTPENRDYSCPLSEITRLAKAIKINKVNYA